MRRLALISSLLGTVAVAAVLLLPWWLGGVLPWIGGAFGLRFNDYAREGYGRFRLESFEIRRPSVLVRAEKIEAETPLVWLWHRWIGRPSAVVAGGWRVDVRSDHAAPAARPPGGWLPLKQKLAVVSRRLEFWLPRAKIGRGVVVWPDGELRFASATWEARTLTSPEVGFRGLTAAVGLVTQANGELRLTAATPGGEGVVTLQTKAAGVMGSLTWLKQRADIVAQFGDVGWRPREASLHANQWAIPAERVKLGAPYAVLRGSGEIEWKHGQLGAEVSADGVPRENSRAPPLSVKLRGHGRAGTFFVDTLDAKLPGVEAHLSDPVAFDRAGRLRSGGARFTVEADLAQQPWIAGRGLVRGEGRIEASAAGLAMIDFSLAGDHLVTTGAEAKRVEVAGRFEWPRLDIVHAKFVTPDGQTLVGSGAWNFDSQTVSDAVVQGKISRGALARWLPDSPKFATLDIAAHAAGPWRELVHDGTIRADAVRVAGLRTLAVEAAWRGRGATIEAFSASILAGKTTLSAAGAGDASQLALAALTMTRGDGRQLKLARPAVIRWRPIFELKDVALVGNGAEVEATLRSAKTGRIDLAVHHLASDWLRDFIPLPPTGWAIDSLALQGKWDRGPVEFSAAGAVTVALGNKRAAQLSIRATGGADGIRLESLRVGEGPGVIVNASARIPIAFNPRRTPFLAVAGDAPFALDAATAANPEFWEKFSELTGLEIVRPEVTAQVEGTLNNPRGEALVRAERVAAVPGRFKGNWPKIEALDVHLVGDRSGVKLDRGSVTVAGQAVRVEGALPVAGARWQKLLSDPVGFARHGELHVEVPDADIAALARYFPAYLAPQGRLQLDLRLTSKANLAGFLRVSGAMSRPLGPLGVLQEIKAELRFDGRAVNFQAVTARMGGQLVTLKGRAELPPEGEPQFDLTLTGENLPFVRRPGLLVRGDLNLKLTSAAAGRTTLGGVVRLRDSLFLTDLRSLIPTGARGLAGRPPYFSVATEPLNRWLLDVNVQGEKFLRLRTPVFNGTASARFQLSGTLGEPRVVGEAVVDEGSVRLPFANFAVQQGQVQLTPDRPEPQLFVTGTTRRYGYDLRMELTGPVSAPRLTFSSSPPLESEQVLLMVMAGQAPRDEIASSDRQRAARIGAYFGQSLLGSLTGDAGGADRLTISSGENVSAQGRETYNIEYRLNDRWALTGEYDQFDEYYGGVKWRFYEKGGKAADGKK